MPSTLNIGMIGYGFMGRAHSNAYRKVGNFFQTKHRPVLKAACARHEAGVKAFADNWGYESIETDWRKLIERKDIDAVDICVPNNLHKEIALAAAAAGKMILCEKPLSMNAADGEEMCQAVEKAGVPNMVWYNYRRVPAVTLAKQLIDEGRLGRIFHYRANFLQDWTISADLPQGGTALWRLDVAAAGSGVTGDLLAHCIDTAIWINGGIRDVTAMTETFVKERKHQLTGKVEKVGIDDACAFLCHFENGSLGPVRIDPLRPRAQGPVHVRNQRREGVHRVGPARSAPPGDTSTTRDEGRLRGWRSIHVTDHGGDHPYMDNWWVPGLQIGYEHSFVHQVADFLEGLDSGKPAQPDFRAALETQKTCDAVLSSAKSGRWVDV